jgi:hypothetical protein
MDEQLVRNNKMSGHTTLVGVAAMVFSMEIMQWEESGRFGHQSGPESIASFGDVKLSSLAASVVANPRLYNPWGQNVSLRGG